MIKFLMILLPIVLFSGCNSVGVYNRDANVNLNQYGINANVNLNQYGISTNIHTNIDF